MNRGRARQTIFHNQDHYEAFLETLKEVVERFDAVIHAYCLMGNHYHLLIETPKANLSRIMRHVNGVYTQRYNRMRKTDGPLSEVDTSPFWWMKMPILTHTKNTRVI